MLEFATRRLPPRWLGAALVIIVLLGGAAGCAGTQPVSEESESRSPGGTAEPGFAPTPFTAEQIRNAMPVDLKVGIAMTLHQNGQTQQQTQYLHVLESTPEKVQLESWTVAGEQESEHRTAWSEWAELRDHAKFPAEMTRIDDFRLTTALGTYDTWRYTIEQDRDGLLDRQEFYFAKDLPGPPILFNRTLGGQPVFEAAIISRETP